MTSDFYVTYIFSLLILYKYTSYLKLMGNNKQLNLSCLSPYEELIYIYIFIS